MAPAVTDDTVECSDLLWPVDFPERKPEELTEEAPGIPELVLGKGKNRGPDMPRVSHLGSW
jgi:hypothetical protein